MDVNIQAIKKYLPDAHVVKGNMRGARGFRYHIEASEMRISSAHRFIADAWKDAFDRVIGAERCENCRSAIHIAVMYGKNVWVHPDGRTICFNDPSDGVAEPADAYYLAKFADEDLS